MDELEISGKRYLSSRRVAKENKYHSDYIGQLIRAGKLVGKKVGRAWYVEADSLSHFLNHTEAPKQAHSAHSEAAVDVSEQKIQESTEKQTFVGEVIEPVHDIQDTAAVATGVEEHHVPVRTEKVWPTEPYRAMSEIVQKKSLTYIPDNAPLFPEIHRNNNTYETHLPTVQTMYTKVLPEREVAAKRTRGRNWGTAAVAAVAVLVVIGIAVGASILVSANLTVEDGKPASVEYSLQ